MKFLIDENVGQSLVDYLVEKGHDVIVSNRLAKREDSFLLDYACQEKMLVITNDKDFGFLVYRQLLPTHGIILFRFAQENPSLKIAALETILSMEESRIINHFVVVSEGKIRIRPLTRR